MHTNNILIKPTSTYITAPSRSIGTKIYKRQLWRSKSQGVVVLVDERGKEIRNGIQPGGILVQSSVYLER